MEVQIEDLKVAEDYPCLMENSDAELIGLVAKSEDGRYFVTVLDGEGISSVHFWETEIQYWKPLPKGQKVILNN